MCQQLHFAIQANFVKCDEPLHYNKMSLIQYNIRAQKTISIEACCTPELVAKSIGSVQVVGLVYLVRGRISVRPICNNTLLAASQIAQQAVCHAISHKKSVLYLFYPACIYMECLPK